MATLTKSLENYFVKIEKQELQTFFYFKLWIAPTIYNTLQSLLSLRIIKIQRSYFKKFKHKVCNTVAP